MRVSQLWNWIILRVKGFQQNDQYVEKFQKYFEQKLFLTRLKIEKKLISEDGTRKYLLALDDGNLIETVFIPEKYRGTLCISSQVGCTLFILFLLELKD